MKKENKKEGFIKSFFKGVDKNLVIKSFIISTIILTFSGVFFGADKTFSFIKSTFKNPILFPTALVISFLLGEVLSSKIISILLGFIISEFLFLIITLTIL